MYATFSRQFQKQLNKAPLSIQIAWKERLYLFFKEPFHPFLHNHPLKGSLQGKRSINVTGDWRVVYEESFPHHILFVSLGTHSQLYK
jgi:addiction module RelE/StbE family toxin